MTFYHRSDLITWSKTFSCGIRLIDSQHRHLVNLVNEMFRHVTGNEEQEHAYLQSIIQGAEDYIKIHFTTEEQILEATKFINYDKHKEAHDNFIMMVDKFVIDFMAGKRISLCMFTKFLKDWVLSHIAVMDKQYFTYLKKIATCKANGKLSITAADVRTAVNSRGDAANNGMYSQSEYNQDVSKAPSNTVTQLPIMYTTSSV